MEYNTMFKVVHRQEFSLPRKSDVVRPDLSFTIQEIQRKFTLQQILNQNENVENHYLLSPDSVEFDSPSVNVRQNYDMVDAFADSHRLYNARKQFVDSIRNPKKISSPTSDDSVLQTDKKVISND